MTNVAPDTSTWHEILRREVDPTQRKALGPKAFGVVAVAAIFTVTGLWLAISGISASGILLASAGVLAIIVWSVVAVGARSAAKWTGDDLIQVVVADKGIVIQGGAAATWNEISDIQWESSKLVSHRGNAANKIGSHLGEAGLNAAGLDTTFKQIQFRLKDWKAIRDRGATKGQRRSVMEPFLGDPAYLPVGLYGATAEEWQSLLDLLSAEAARHGVPIARKPTV